MSRPDYVQESHRHHFRSVKWLHYPYLSFCNCFSLTTAGAIRRDSRIEQDNFPGCTTGPGHAGFITGFANNVPIVLSSMSCGSRGGFRAAGDNIWKWLKKCNGFRFSDVICRPASCLHWRAQCPLLSPVTRDSTFKTGLDKKCQINRLS